MRKLLILTGCVALAGVLGAAQHDDQDNYNQGKKKGGNAPQNATLPATSGAGKKFKAGPGGGPQYNTQNAQSPSTVHFRRGGGNVNPSLNAQNPNTVGNFKAGKKDKWRGPVTDQGVENPTTNVSGNAAKTKFGKGQGKLSTAHPVGAKFEKKHFNLQTNNKQFVINKYKTVKFNQNYKIAGAYKWKSNPKLQVFVNYSPVWHDTWWYNSYHPHVVFIFGGWYYWDNYYWYPAWGYAPDSVYVYDGPIYASSPAEDPGQVVANVQSALQEQGYYQGEIDGILGPQTRAALAEYQSAQGLEPTGLVDEPTLETLGMA